MFQGQAGPKGYHGKKKTKPKNKKTPKPAEIYHFTERNIIIATLKTNNKTAKTI